MLQNNFLRGASAALLFYAGDVTKLKSRLGQGDGQGGKYVIDRPAFDVAGFIALSSFSLRSVPTTLSNLRNQPYSVANLSITKNFKLGEKKRLQIRGAECFQSSVLHRSQCGSE